MSSPYRILGIRPTTSYEDAKRIYRKKMKELHPDRGGNPKDMNQAKEAWDYLKANKDTMLGQSSDGISHQSLFVITD
jgi:curved DNA-binding protein CbpA